MSRASTESQDPINPTYAYAGAFVDELQRAGVRNVVICPGSRSTPLAITFAAQSAIRAWIHVDERSAAYFGLGMAKQLHQPVALLCTSGTAAANFLPAIVEAKLTHIPLLVLTADRPHELRDNGAPQSIDQNRLYGTYVKWFVEVALPEATNAALRYIRTVAVRAVALTQAIPAGPVHLNLPFREPLTPEPIPDHPLPQVTQRDLVAWQGRSNNTPHVEVRNALPGAPTATTIAYMMDLVHRARRGLIIFGPNDDPPLAEPLVRLAQRLGYPILADPLSQLRCGDHDQGMVISSYDAFLRIDSFIESAQPELVLRFGAMPTSKPVLLYLKRFASCPLVVIDGHGGWEEPTQLASALIHADPAALCQGLFQVFEQPDENGAKQPSISQEWITMWQNADRVTRQTLQIAIQDFNELFEGRVFTELADLLPGDAALYVGNSMPVRDLDTFFWPTEKRIRIMGNRGTNGIDGVVSSALGASAGAGQNRPTILVLGDLSFFHDLNGLLAARLHGLNLTIVLINNDGGGIFSFLPQAAYPEHFEQLFGTPTGLDFRLAVQMYGGQYQKVESWEQFRKGVRLGLDTGGLRVIEVPTERASNVKMHRHLWEVVGKALGEQGKGMEELKMGSTFVQVNGIRLGIEQRGGPRFIVGPPKSGPTLVMLHGFTGSAAGWGNHLETLAAYGLRVMALDLPGHGQSDAPADPQRYTIEYCQQDILAALHELGVDQGEAVLLGYSMGGRIALYTAFSGFFRALILESASPGLEDEASREQRRLSDEALAASIEYDGVQAFIDRWEKLPLFTSQSTLPPEVREALRRQRLSNRASGLAQSLRGIGTGGQPSLHARLPALHIPVLLIAGELDPKFTAIARSMAQALPQSQLRIVPGAGHAVHLERPEEFVSLVGDFSLSMISS